MFARFFKKKAPQDQREHYRRAPGRKAALGVKLVAGDGAVLPGELIDVSAGGAAIRFDSDVSEHLELDTMRELRFTSLKQRGISVQAVVRSGPREGQPNRYGFQFLDPGELFQQADESFYKYFNRRRWPRAQPALDRAVKGEVAFGDAMVDIAVHDISRDGVSFRVNEDMVDVLNVDSSLEVTIFVPKTDASVTFFGLVRHKTAASEGPRVGCSLEPRETPENKKRLKKDLAALEDYIARRVVEIEKFNTAYN